MPKKGLVTIDPKQCKSCGICVEFCPRKVLISEEPLLKAKVADPERCNACQLCEIYCPDWAISVVEADEAGTDAAAAAAATATGAVGKEGAR